MVVAAGSYKPYQLSTCAFGDGVSKLYVAHMLPTCPSLLSLFYFPLLHMIIAVSLTRPCLFLFLFVHLLLCFDVDDLYPSLPSPFHVLISMLIAYLSCLFTTHTSSLRIGSHSVDYALVSFFSLTIAIYIQFSSRMLGLLRFSPHFCFASHHHVHLEVINANVCFTFRTFLSSHLCA